MMSIHRKSYWLNMKYKVNMLFFEVDISTNLKNCICYTIFSQTNETRRICMFSRIFTLNYQVLHVFLGTSQYCNCIVNYSFFSMWLVANLSDLYLNYLLKVIFLKIWKSWTFDYDIMNVTVVHIPCTV